MGFGDFEGEDTTYEDKIIEAHMTDSSFRKSLKSKKKRKVLKVDFGFLRKMKGRYVLLNKENEFLTKNLSFTKTLEKAYIFKEWLNASEQVKKIDNCRIVQI